MAIIGLDDFTGTAGPFSSRVATTGGTWQLIGTGARISPTGTSATGENQYTGAGARLPLSVANASLSVPFAAPNVDDQTLLLYLRWADADNLYAAKLTTFSRRFSLLKRVAGVETELGTAYIIPTLAINTTYTLLFTVTGTALTLAIDGTDRITTTDSAISAAGQAGWFEGGQQSTSGNSYTGIRLDSFTVDDLLGGGGSGLAAVLMRRRLG